jgi:hypothetical protein
VQILQDVFPAFVVFAASTAPFEAWDLTSAPPTKHPEVHQVLKTRVIISDTRIIIAQDATSGPKVIFNQPYSPGNRFKGPDNRTDSWVIADNGTKVAFKKDTNCGCGSRLRSWSPYTISDSVRDPSA